MERRNKERLDLQLICHIAPGEVLSRVLSGLTDNVSRTGMLLRWNGAVAPPAKGSPLVVEVELPEGFGFGRRLMRCDTTVVRVETSSLGLRINKMQFVKADAGLKLAEMPAISEQVN